MVKQRVGIVFGGKSTEHEVSLKSAKNIINAIDKNYFEVVLLGIDKKGRWYINNIKQNLLLDTDNLIRSTINNSDIKVAIVPGTKQGQLVNASNGHPLLQINVIFPIVHGALGEDGSLQGMLRMTNLPFVGSDVLGSAVCMDKDITKRLLREAGLCVVPFITLTRASYNDFTFKQISAKVGLPMFVKPANQGSSIGISKVTNETQFVKAIELAFEFDHKVIVEKGIAGREIECAILGNDFPQASTCGEVIQNNSSFYSYDTKYIDNNNVHIVVPAEIDTKINNKIREIAIKAYRTLSCLGMARVDVFLTSDNEVFINEINTLPGFTNISMYPKLWKASNLSYKDLITRLIELAIERHVANNTLKHSIKD